LNIFLKPYYAFLTTSSVNMKLSLFSAVALLGLTAAAIPSPGVGVDANNQTVQAIQKRQAGNRPDVSQPAMSTVNGGVVPYDAAGVAEQRKKRAEMKKKRGQAAGAKVKKHH
jgi:hypothetical protein